MIAAMPGELVIDQLARSAEVCEVYDTAPDEPEPPLHVRAPRRTRIIRTAE